MKFSLIIPCYNEAESLPMLVERCFSLAKQVNIEIILVDNGSTDKSPEILSKLLGENSSCRSIRVDKNIGYGAGILAGLKASKGDIIGWTHADLQTDPLDVLKAIDIFNEHGNNILVKGRRFGRPISDVFFTLGMSVFETLLLRKPLWDINAQPTMFSRAFFNTWQNAPHDFSLDLFAYYKAKKDEVKVKRFPVLFGERAHGISHWNVDFSAKRKFIKRTVDYSLKLRKNLNK